MSDKKEFNNEMRFALFKNDKGDNPKRPDYQGTMQIAGVQYKLSAWIRDGKSGKFMSGEIKAKADEATGKQGFDAARKAADDAKWLPAEKPKLGASDSDDVPF